MRAARAKDHWRHLYEKTPPTRFESLQFLGVPGLGDGDIGFGGAITVICGGNGVGKSTLVDAAIASVTSNLDSLRRTSTARLEGGLLRAELHLNGERVVVDSSFVAGQINASSGQGAECHTTLIDSSLESLKLIEYFSEMENLDELLESLSPASLEEDELSTLSALVGKRYDSCDIYEIEEFDDEVPVPYFVVESGGVRYGTEGMGQGELSLMLFIGTWVRSRRNQLFFWKSRRVTYRRAHRWFY